MTKKFNKSKNAKVLTYSLACLVIIIDQFTKYIALSNLNYGETVPVLGNALQWILVKNPGAAFSLLENATWVFTIISSIVAVTVLVLTRKISEYKWAVVSGLVLAGAIGNLIDRIFRDPGFAIGHVIDFIFTPWIVPAVYNVADIAIVTGMGLFLLFSLLPENKKQLAESAEHDA